MLRNLGYTANYAIAEIVITDYDLFNMTSTSDIEAAKRIFTSQGKTLENVGAGRYKTEHTLVALELDGVQYPLDPSFKYYKTDNFIDLTSMMNNLESQYDLSSENINLLDVSAKIESSFNEQSIIDIISSREIIDQNITTIPTSVQYDFFSQDILISPSIPMANCDFIELYLGNFKVFSYPSSYLYNKNLTIEYELTEDAEFYLNEIYGFGINGIDDLTKRLGTYKNLAQIYAVVKIDGKKIATGNSNLLGTKENMRLNVRSAGGIANFEKELTYGGLYSVVLTTI